MLNKEDLSQGIKDALYMSAYNALLATFKDSVPESALQSSKDLCEKFAKAFSETASDTLTDVIHAYVNSMTINLSTSGPQTLVVTGMSPAGPITGTAVGPLVGTLNAMNKGVL